MAFETVVVDIDTQWDLVMPDGSWPVPGAFGLSPNFERVTRYARMYNIPVLATTQSLDAGDPRFSGEDAVPPHCIRGTPGQMKVPATRPVQPVTLDLTPLSPADLEQAVRGSREIVLETSGPDLLSNPNTAHLLAVTKNAIVFGVALDGAVGRAMKWLLDKGIAVDLVQNATLPRSAEPDVRDNLIADLVALGARKIRDIDIMSRFTTARHR